MFKTSIIKYTQYLFILLFSLWGASFLYSAKEPQAINYYKKAQAFIAEYNYFEATEWLRQALKENPYFFDAKMLLADSYFLLKNYSTAWSLYLELEVAQPDNIDLMIKLAKTKIALSTHSNSIVGATFYLNKAYKIAPRNPQVIATYGSYYYVIGDYKKAMEYYNLLGPNPNNIRIHINKAKVYEQWADNPNWLKELKNAETLNSSNYEVLMELAQYYSANEMFDVAIEYFTMAQKVNPRNTEALLGFVQLYLNQKDYEAAIPYLSQILLKDKTNSLLYYYMAVAYEALGDFNKSVEVLKAGLEYDFGNEFLRVKAEEISTKHFPLGSEGRSKLSDYYSYSLPSVSSGSLNINTLFFLSRSLRINPLSLPTRLRLANIYRQKGYVYEYLRTIRTGLFLDPKNEKLNTEIKLNKRFSLSTLESKEDVAPFSTFETKPVYSIGDVIIKNNSTYLYFGSELKQLLLEAFSATKQVNAFIKGQGDQNKMPDFEIRMVVHPDQYKISLKAELIYLKTGAVFKVHYINEYGNNKLYNSVLSLTEKVVNESPMIGKIIKIKGREAITSLGAIQGVKKGDSILILKDNALSFTLFQNKPLTKTQNNELGLASGKVLEVGENISRISFTPLENIIFNLVQPNQNVLIIKKRAS